MTCKMCGADFTEIHPRWCRPCRDAITRFGEARVRQLVAVRQRAGTENLTAEEQARLDFEKWLHPEDIRRQRE